MTEIERQQLLHQKYDSDEDVELQRLFSKTPVGVPGRSGRGVIPSLDSIIQGMWVTALYQMVNAHRNEIFTLALVEYTRLTGANA